MPESDLELGEIIQIEGSRAAVELVDKDACDSCSARFICRPDDSGKRVLHVYNSLNAKIGDRVLIEQSEVNQLRLTAMQYGLPLLGFLITVIIANRYLPPSILVIPNELRAFVAGIVVVIILGFVTRAWIKRKVAQDFSIFQMKRVVKNFGNRYPIMNHGL